MTDRACSTHPYVEIHEGKVDELKTICERFVAATAEEDRCLY